MKEIMIAVILWIISVLVFILGICSLKGKGFLLNNAYLYASRQERETMDKKAYYRQSAVVFFLLSAVFLLNGFEVIFQVDRLSHIATATIIITVVYAVISSIMIEKQKK